MSPLRPGLTHINPIPERQKDRCRVSGKVRWMSQGDAEIAVMIHQDGVGSAYYCFHCKHWHLTRRQ